MRSLHTFVLVIAAALLASGCASTNVKKEAFAKPPKLAVVTIFGDVHHLFTNSTDDAKILADTVPVCLNELAKSHNIRLLPPKAALSAKAYAAIKDDPSVFMTSFPGYKQFNAEKEKQNLQALARELHVDGFVLVSLYYSRSSGGIGIGPMAFSSEKPVATLAIGAYNAAGETLWTGNTKKEADDGSFGFSLLGVTATEYSKMIGQLKGLTQIACQQAVKDLAEQVAAK